MQSLSFQGQGSPTAFRLEKLSDLLELQNSLVTYLMSSQGMK